MRIPSILDILIAANRMNGALPPKEDFIRPPSIDDKNMVNSVVHRFLDGVESEARSFQAMKPSYFFICPILKFYEAGSGVFDCEILIPVILKDNQYYIIPSEEKAKVYRVIDPVRTFFSEKGHEIIKIILGTPFVGCGGRVTFDKNVRGKSHRVFCIPDAPHRGPANVWDFANLTEVDAMVPYPTGYTSSIPEGSKFAVQVIRLSESDQNIVDIVLDDSDEISDTE